MITVDLVDPIGYTIFCDDVRQEATGKLLFIGVYRGDMFIHTPFPAILNQFWAYVQITIPRTYKDRLGDEIKVTVLLPGVEESLCPTASVPAKNIVWDDPHLELSDAEAQTVCKIEFPFPFAQMTLQRPGSIKVRCTIGDRIFRLGALRIHAAAPIQPAQSSAP